MTVTRAGCIGPAIVLVTLVCAAAPLHVQAASSPASEGAGTLSDTSEGIRRAQESVIKVTARIEGDVKEPPKTSSGSGFMFDGGRGLVLTAAHLVPKSAAITVVDAKGTRGDATLIKVDAETDLALVQIKAGSAPSLPLSSETPAEGQVVYAVGWALQQPAMSVVQDTVTALRRGEVEFMTTHSPFHAGMSGAPIVNSRGELVGVASAVVLGDGSMPPEGFALPLSEVRRALTRLQAGK